MFPTEDSTRSRPSTSKDHKKTELPSDFQPNCYSVICGRGGACFNSIGNRRFRVIVTMFLQQYSAANTKLAKSKIVTQIIGMIQSAGGGFVKYEKGRWYEVSDGMAREKVGALFRDCLHTQYRSAAKSKLARRKAQQAGEDDDNSLEGDDIATTEAWEKHNNAKESFEAIGQNVYAM